MDGKVIYIQNTLQWFYNGIDRDDFDDLINSGELLKTKTEIQYLVIKEEIE